MDGDGPQPWALYFSRVCEAWPTVKPSELLEEIAQLPVGELEALLEARAYEREHRFYKHEQDPKAESELRQMVKVIESELAQEEIDQQHA